MEITDKDILNSLKAKKEKLIAEIHRVDLAICAYEGVDIPVDINTELVDKYKDVGLVEIVDNKSAILPEYNANLSYSEKILYVLNKRGASYVTEIVDELLKLEPVVFTRDKLLKRITIMTSRLFTSKKIAAKRVGRKNKYMLLARNTKGE